MTPGAGIGFGIAIAIGIDREIEDIFSNVCTIPDPDSDPDSDADSEVYLAGILDGIC